MANNTGKMGFRDFFCCQPAANNSPNMTKMGVCGFFFVRWDWNSFFTPPRRGSYPSPMGWVSQNEALFLHLLQACPPHHGWSEPRLPQAEWVASIGAILHLVDDAAAWGAAEPFVAPLLARAGRPIRFCCHKAVCTCLLSCSQNDPILDPVQVCGCSALLS